MTERRATNFFARQDEARGNCRKLIMLFLAAVGVIVFAVYCVVRLLWYLSLSTNIPTSAELQAKIQAFTFWDTLIFIIVSLVVCFVIFIACALKMRELKGGGAAVAKMLGGRLISWKALDKDERQLLNIVEEMAIAAGIAVPQVYVLDNEKSINAFAAGLRLDDAVIAVTRGAIERFNREEMQGVIAHEFSHILHGDSRLNIQLIGLIYGIMVIGIIGNELTEQKLSSRLSPLAFFTGVLLKIIGSGGTFMGKLIQCGISRQKELLADASAVRFTRNPQGLASALKKIGGYVHGSQIESAKAAQASHLFFSESRTVSFFKTILATHPPLSLRIALLDPSFDGKFTVLTEAAPAFSFAHQEAQLSYAASPLQRESFTVNAAQVTGRVGNPAENNSGCGSAILDAIPPEIRQLLNSPAGAVRIITALIMGEKCDERAAQIKTIRGYLDGSADYEEVLRLGVLLSEMPGEQRIPLVELAMPQLRTLAGMERRNFLAIISSLIGADAKITLFEFCVQWIIQESLIREKEDVFSKVCFFSPAQVGYHILIILRALACAGNIGNAAAARAAFQKGISQIPELAAKNPDFLYAENINYASVGTAFRQLGLSSFKVKQAVVEACAHCAFVDARVTVEESELLRVISLALHCPLPPFAPEASVLSA